MTVNDIGLFLVHAIQQEREAARRYEELTEAMATGGNRELKEFFGRMATFSRRHLAEAMARGGFRELPALKPEDYDWPDGTSPETADWEGVDALMGEREALAVALSGERRGHAYYAAIAATTRDPDVRVLAGQFAEEEGEHVAELERRMARTDGAGASG